MTRRRDETPRTEDDHLAGDPARRGRRGAAACRLRRLDRPRALARAVEDAGVDPGLSRLRLPARRRRPGAGLPRRAATRALAARPRRRRPSRPALPRPDRLRRHPPARSWSPTTARRCGAARRSSRCRTHAADGARAIWRTADTIWTALGDDSRDFNWYTKRATLSAVYSSSAALLARRRHARRFAATREFIDRRIDDVMRIEDVKVDAREATRSPSAMMKGPQRLLDRVKAPEDTRALRSAGLAGGADPDGTDAGRTRHGARRARCHLVRRALARGQRADHRRGRPRGLAGHDGLRRRARLRGRHPRSRPALRPRCIRSAEAMGLDAPEDARRRSTALIRDGIRRNSRRTRRSTCAR